MLAEDVCGEITVRAKTPLGITAFSPWGVRTVTLVALVYSLAPATPSTVT